VARRHRGAVMISSIREILYNRYLIKQQAERIKELEEALITQNKYICDLEGALRKWVKQEEDNCNEQVGNAN